MKPIGEKRVYSGGLNDVFAIQDNIAALLEEALEIDPYYTPAIVWMVAARRLGDSADATHRSACG